MTACAAASRTFLRPATAGTVLSRSRGDGFSALNTSVGARAPVTARLGRSLGGGGGAGFAPWVWSSSASTSSSPLLCQRRPHQRRVVVRNSRGLRAGEPSAAWAWERSSETSTSRRRRRGAALVPRSSASADDGNGDPKRGGDVETTEEEVDALAKRLESLRAKSRSMLAEAASLEKQVVKAESQEGGGGDATTGETTVMVRPAVDAKSLEGSSGDATMSETTVIVRSAGDAKKAKREEAADAIAAATGGGDGGGGDAAATAAMAAMARSALGGASSGGEGGVGGGDLGTPQMLMPEFLRRVQELQVGGFSFGSKPEKMKTETLVAGAAAAIAIVAVGGTSALGVAISREPLFALLGSTAAFAALKAIETLAPKIEEFQQAQEKVRLGVAFFFFSQDV